MRKQAVIIVGVTWSSFLIGTMFSTSYLASGKPPSVWDVINQLQSQVNALTTTVNEQQAHITELQTQVNILNATKLGKPDYETEWLTLQQAQWYVIQHNLGTTNLLVYALERETQSMQIHQYMLYDHQVVWIMPSENEVWIEFGEPQVNQFQFRVMLWKIP